MERLIEIIERAYELSMQVQDGVIDTVLAEELSGECAELLAHIEQDEGAFDGDECKDAQLVALAKLILSMGEN